MMFDAYSLALGLVSGVVAGVVFFGGLSATTRLLNRSQSVGVLFVASFLLRAATVAGGAWFVATHGDQIGLLAYLFAIIGVRTVLVRRARRAAAVEDA